MTSKREQVLEALLALLGGAAAGVGAVRNEAAPAALPGAGAIYMRDGDPGDPEVILSPLTYVFSHAVAVTVAVPAGDAAPVALDAILGAIGTAIVADRTLGGLCDWLEARAPQSDAIEAAGAVPGLYADFTILASYTTRDPLN